MCVNLWLIKIGLISKLRNQKAVTSVALVVVPLIASGTLLSPEDADFYRGAKARLTF